MLSTSAIGKNRFDRIFRVKRTLLNVVFTRVSLFDRLRSFPQNGTLADLKKKKWSRQHALLKTDVRTGTIRSHVEKPRTFVHG